MGRQMQTSERERHENRWTGATGKKAMGQTGEGTDKNRDEWTDGQTSQTKGMDGELDGPTGRGQKAKQA